MFKKVSYLVLLLCLVMGAQVFLGCSESDDGDVPRFGSRGDVSIDGYWKSTYGDGFEIDGNTYKQYDDASKAVSFAGTIVGEVAENEGLRRAKWGYMTIKITEAGSWGKTVDYYYVLHWKDLTSTSVQQSSASSADYTAPINNGRPTLAEAVGEYTEEKGYFGSHGMYARQP